MNTTKSKEFIELAEQKTKIQLLDYAENKLPNEKIEELSKEIVSKIDWNNKALMHKGFSWIAKNVLIDRGIIKL